MRERLNLLTAGQSFRLIQANWNLWWIGDEVADHPEGYIAGWLGGCRRCCPSQRTGPKWDTELKYKLALSWLLFKVSFSMIWGRKHPTQLITYRNCSFDVELRDIEDLRPIPIVIVVPTSSAREIQLRVLHFRPESSRRLNESQDRAHKTIEKRVRVM